MTRFSFTRFFFDLKVITHCKNMTSLFLIADAGFSWLNKQFQTKTSDSKIFFA